jgi:8-oxo-dGTP pyrophosphatase MutT (NUDIX family)
MSAVRELFEEAGVLLARLPSGQSVPVSDPESHARFARYRRALHDRRLTLREIANRENLRIAFDALTLFAHWVTPAVDKRRFDTRFFAARVPAGQTPVHDRTETSEGVWLRPKAALAAAMESSGESSIVLPPPTWVTLRELEAFRSVDDAIGWAERRDVRRRQPHVIQDGGARTIVMPEDVTPRVRFVFAEGRWQPA